MRAYLAKKGLSIPCVAVNLAAMEQFSEAYRALNPRFAVPTLVIEDGTAIGDLPAIWRFIEQAFASTAASDSV